MMQESHFDLYEYIDICLLDLDLTSVEYIELSSRLCKSCKNKKDVDREMKKLRKKYIKEKN